MVQSGAVLGVVGWDLDFVDFVKRVSWSLWVDPVQGFHLFALWTWLWVLVGSLFEIEHFFLFVFCVFWVCSGINFFRSFLIFEGNKGIIFKGMFLV